MTSMIMNIIYVSEKLFSVNTKTRHRGSISVLASRGSEIGRTSFVTRRDPMRERISATELIEYENGTLGKSDDGNIWYLNRTPRQQVKLINMDVLNPAPRVLYLNQSQTESVNIYDSFVYRNRNIEVLYGFMHSMRRYIKPDLYAGVLGAVAQFREDGNTHYIVSQGFSYEDASCYPSAEHVNGEAGDFNLLSDYLDGRNTLLNNRDFDYDAQLVFRNLLFSFGFQSGRSENFSNTSNESQADNQTTRLPNTTPTTSPPHDNHLHVHNFMNVYELL